MRRLARSSACWGAGQGDLALQLQPRGLALHPRVARDVARGGQRLVVPLAVLGQWQRGGVARDLAGQAVAPGGVLAPGVGQEELTVAASLGRDVLQRREPRRPAGAQRIDQRALDGHLHGGGLALAVGLVELAAGLASVELDEQLAGA
ncbi:hypothetical protein, partial [Mitsuaria sp. TWR114]|uniref:hypothetical protein n=1 Tax=Mitsuaria sp. TWR114 TaxID=2601731 RepID=UPI001C9A7332